MFYWSTNILKKYNISDRISAIRGDFMLYELSKLIYDYYKQQKFADKYFVETATNIILDNMNLSDYINNFTIISLDEKSTSYSGSSYDFKDKELIIDLVYEKNKRKYSFNRNNKYLYYNLEIIRTIFHELDHALLNKEIINNKNTIDILLSKEIFDWYIKNCPETSNKEKSKEQLYIEIVELERKKMYYYENHNKAPYERRANLISLLKMNELLKSINDTNINPKKIEYYNKKYRKKTIKIAKGNYVLYKKYGYTNSPSLDYFIKFDYKNKNKFEEAKTYYYDKNKSFENTNQKYKFEEKIFYGLQLSKDEFNKLDSSYDILSKKLYKKTL